MRILLAIKPKFANAIMDGSKLFEYRKCVPKDEPTTVVIYSSSPVQKVIGEFDVVDIVKKCPEALWKETSDGSGISFDFFSEYFASREEAFAFRIGEVRKYDSEIELREFGISHPPQNFLYLSCSLKGIYGNRNVV